MNTKRLKRIVIRCQNPRLHSYFSVYDCNKSIIEMKKSVYSLIDNDINNVKLQGIKFIRRI